MTEHEYTPQEIRDRIEECKQDLARAEGEEAALNEKIESSLVKLRETLGCKPGKEKDAIQKLKKKIAKSETRLASLLDKADGILGGEEDDDE